jgi:two-component system chemotaxis response regulator CheY
MDGKDGFAVLADCKAMHPQTKVILCSGDVVYATLSKAFACGADSFLAKPFRFGELLHQIKKCLAREQPQNQGITAVQAHAPQAFDKKSCSG